MWLRRLAPPRCRCGAIATTELMHDDALHAHLCQGFGLRELRKRTDEARRQAREARLAALERSAASRKRRARAIAVTTDRNLNGAHTNATP